MNFFLENKDEIFRLSERGTLTAKESYDRVHHLKGCPVFTVYRFYYPLFAAMMKDFSAGPLSPDRRSSPRNPSEVPRNYKGWTVRLRRGKYYELYKKTDGALHVIYVGKHWKDQIADEKIRNFRKD
jgi:hypothetical protein